MKITLDVNDNKAAAFINFIKSLDFINVETLDHDLTQDQMNEVNKRLDKHKNNPSNAIDFDIAMDEIEKEL